MVIKLWTTDISKINLGTTPIVSVYKGSDKIRPELSWIEFVWYANVTSNGGAWTSTINLTTITWGIDTQPREWDVVVVSWGAYSTIDLNLNVITAWYTRIVDLYANSNDDANVVVSWKLMWSTPDTSVEIERATTTNHWSVMYVTVWRWISNISPIWTINTNTWINSWQPYPPSINSSSGNIILSVWWASLNSTINPFTTSDYTSFYQDTNSTSTRHRLWVWYLISSWGTFTPSQRWWWATWSRPSWWACTIEIRNKNNSSPRTPWINTVWYYPLNWDANDYSSNANHWTASNITWTAFHWKQCASFNGTSSSITIPHQSYLNFWTWNFTISFILEPNTLSTYQRIINKYRNTPVNNWWEIRTGNTTSSTWYVYTYDWSATDWTTPSWYFSNSVIWVYQIVRNWTTISFYKNWYLFHSITWTARNMSNSYNISVWNMQWSWWYNGKMSELILENKARTAQEVLDYNNLNT